MAGPKIMVALTAKAQLAVKDAAFAFRPASEHDYIRIRRVMVAKSLVAAVLLLVNLVLIAVIALLLYSAPVASENGVRAYRYNSFRLRGYTGVATVLGKNGNPVYTGELLKGKATGYGELKDHEGQPVYSGEFFENRYDGDGELFYPDGTVRYSGGFKNNLFSGTGILYRPSGVKSYEGAFVTGQKQGAGVSFDALGRIAYTGNFIGGNIFLKGYIGGESVSLGDFGGERALYEGVYDISVALREFGVVYVLNRAVDGGASATVMRMYDVSGADSQQSEPLTARDLREKHGAPFYVGYADVLAPDFAAAAELERLNKLPSDSGLRYELSTVAEGIYEVGYEPGQKLYLESYRDGDWFYTYYFPQSAKPYLFYSVERAGALNSGE